MDPSVSSLEIMDRTEPVPPGGCFGHANPRRRLTLQLSPVQMLFEEFLHRLVKRESVFLVVKTVPFVCLSPCTHIHAALRNASTI